MDPRRVWPDFDDACIVHEDDAIIVVDKPAGVPTQAADPEGARQIARVEAGKPAPTEPLPQQLGLAAALIRQRGIELTLDAVLAIPRRLAVANQQQPRRRRPGSDR